MIRILALILVASAPVLGQIHPGLKAGAPLTDVTTTFSTGSDTRANLPSHWTVGPMIELDLPLGFGVEFDALYRRVGYHRFASRVGPDGDFKSGLGIFRFSRNISFPDTLFGPTLGWVGHTVASAICSIVSVPVPTVLCSQAE